MTRDHGSASVWVVSACALLLTVGAVVTMRTSAVALRHHAETAADLAALAAAAQIGRGGDPCAAATSIALRNGAHIRICRVDVAAGGRSGTVDVAVRVESQLPIVGRRQVTASARAGRLPRASAARRRAG